MTPPINKSATPKRIICILGMHRSGTSCLTGSLQQHGLELAEHSTWNLHNKKGNRENSSVVSFHEQLLADNQGTWDKPPGKVIWQDKHYRQAEQILSDHANIPLWGFKDPRMLIALQGWKTIAPHIEFVGIYRNPVAVAQSIAKRGSGIISFEKGLEIWHQYNKRLLKEYKNAPFPLMSFDWPEEKFLQGIDDLVKELELPDQPTDAAFFSNQLVTNNKASEQKVPWKIRRLYKKLQSINS